MTPSLEPVEVSISKFVISTKIFSESESNEYYVYSSVDSDFLTKMAISCGGLKDMGSLSFLGLGLSSSVNSEEERLWASWAINEEG